MNNTKNTFRHEGGQFWLKNRPLFIHAGEFHYFRAPADQWAHRLGLLKTAGFNTVAAYIPWLWHQPQPGISDLDGHTHPMRDLAGFLDLAAGMSFHLIARPGPYIMAETINEGIPPWVFSQYPQAAFIAQDGSAQNIASCLHPDFLHCVEAWYKAVFAVLSPRQVTRGGNILLVQLDNEMGMLQWVRNHVDINPDTLARFADYLHQTFGERLHARYPAADLAGLLREQLTTPRPPYAVRVLEDYRRFSRAYLRDYTAFLWKRAKAHGMEVPPVINIHGFSNGSGKTFPIGLSQLADVMAMEGVVSATDVYPISIGEGSFHQLVLVNEMTKAVQNAAQPLFSIEFQAGGNADFGGAQSSLYDLHSRLSIACGMRAINHYLFFDGENDSLLSPIKRHDWGHPVRKDGTIRRHYARYGELSRVLAAYGDALVRARPKTVTTIGFLLDHFMTEVDNAETRPHSQILTHQREVILFDFLARGLALTHRPFDALELTRSRLDVAQTPVLWVMMEKQCDADIQQKLANYVQAGGRLVLVGGMCQTTFDHAPCSILADATGIQSLHSDPPFTSAMIRAFGYQDVPVSFLETYSGDFDEVFATSADGQTVGFTKRIGKGEVIVLGAALAANTLDDLDILHQMANRVGCAPLFTPSEWADVRLSQSEDGDFLFVNNYQDDPIRTTIAMNGLPLFGDHPVLLPARRGAILPLNWQPRPGIVIHFCTSEITHVLEETNRVVITTAQAECVVEMTVAGYTCEDASIVQQSGNDRLTLHISNSRLELRKTR